MTDEQSVLEPQFHDLAQQREVAWLGMWVFLATEVLMFGALFTSWAAYHERSAGAWAKATAELSLITGTVLTAILLTSSLAVAYAVHAAKAGQRRPVIIGLLVAAGLGLVFIGLEGWEYSHLIQARKWPDSRFEFPGPEAGQVKLFFGLYVSMTGLHMCHVLVGVLLVGAAALGTVLGRWPTKRPHAIALVGLYWHFVDIVWVFLFPAYYLIGRHG